MNMLLDVVGLEARYDRSQVLHGVSFSVAEGEIISLLGRNGMGKSTSIKCIIGLLGLHKGTIRFANREVNGLPAFEVARMGIGLVPEGRHIFPTLTVEENLLATASNRNKVADGFNLDRVYAFFPRLKERRANMGNQLSGGEQQMLAIGRALMTNPRLLILDEATEGLAPLVRADIWRVLGELRKTGMSMIVVDKNLGPLLNLADRHYVVEKGRVMWSGSSDEFRDQSASIEKFLGV